jgi:hypothetical protein
MISIGLNTGHGHTKAVMINGEETIMEEFPSQVALATSEAIGVGRALTVTNDRKVYWYGDSAELGDPLSIYGTERLYNDTLIPALARAAMERMEITNPPIVFGCLPANIADSPNHQSALIQKIKAGTGAAKVGVLPEPKAAAMFLLLNHEGNTLNGDIAQQRILIVDIGAGTTDVTVLNRLNVEPKSVSTMQEGMTSALTQVQRLIQRDLGRNASLVLTDMAVRGRAIKVRGKFEQLPDGWELPMRAFAQSIVTFLNRHFGNAADMDRVLLVGGGSCEPIITETIQHSYPHAEVVPEAQNAIARGAARLGQRMLKIK